MLKLMNRVFDSATNWWGLWSQFISLPPLVLRIRITNRCNLSCPYCYVGKSLNKKTEYPLSLEEWRMIFKKLSPFTLVDITGGEPLLAPGINNLLTSLLDRRMKVSLISNGTIFNEELFSLIVQKKLMHLMISLDGSEHIHDKIRGKGAFGKALKTVKAIQDLKQKHKSSYPKLVAKVTLTELNIGELNEFCSFLFNEVKLDGVTLNLLFDNDARNGFTEDESINSKKFSQGNTVIFDATQREIFVENIKRVRQTYGHRIQVRPDISDIDLEVYFSDAKKVMPHNCYKFNSIVTLYSDGVITPCDLGLDVGNVRDINFDIRKAFRQKRMKEFLGVMRSRTSQELPGCGGCCLKKHEKVV